MSEKYIFFINYSIKKRNCSLILVLPSLYYSAQMLSLCYVPTIVTSPSVHIARNAWLLMFNACFCFVSIMTENRDRATENALFHHLIVAFFSFRCPLYVLCHFSTEPQHTVKNHHRQWLLINYAFSLVE